MIVNVYSSNNKSLIFCLEDIYQQIKTIDFDFILFSISPSFPINHVNPLIQRVFKTNKYVAFHAVEAFQNCSIVDDGVIAVVFKFERDGEVSVFYQDNIFSDEVLINSANYFNNNQDKFHIMIGGYVEGNFGFFLEKLSDKLNYKVDNIVGGISSGIEVDGKIVSYQFVDDKIIKEGFVVLSFENIKGVIDISLGFKPYGITYNITKAKDSKIYEVDNERKFSEIIKSILSDIEDIDMRYLWYTPINILDEKNGYVSTLRTIEYFNDEYVKFYGPVKEGQHFKMSFATSKNLLEEDEKIAKRVLSKISLPDVIFNFSCIAREYVLEDKRDFEIRLYTDILNAHLFGFFTFGEIGPDKNFNSLKLYNETSLLVAMREK